MQKKTCFLSARLTWIASIDADESAVVDENPVFFVSRHFSDYIIPSSMLLQSVNNTTPDDGLYYDCFDRAFVVVQESVASVSPTHIIMAIKGQSRVITQTLMNYIISGHSEIHIIATLNPVVNPKMLLAIQHLLAAQHNFLHIKIS